jgi:hypothetical protein
VNETAQDVLWLQRLLDDSYTRSGPVHVPPARQGSVDAGGGLTELL